MLGENKENVAIDPYLRTRQSELVAIIEAIDAVKGSKYWKVLQKNIFDGVLQSLQHRIRNEKDTKELFRLQGQLGWAEKYCDLDKLAKVYRNELEKVTHQLKQYG